MNSMNKQGKQFHATLIVTVLFSGLIAVFAQSVGEASAQERLANPATYSETA